MSANFLLLYLPANFLLIAGELDGKRIDILDFVKFSILFDAENDNILRKTPLISVLSVNTDTNITVKIYCHSPTQHQLELVLDLIMGRNPPHPTHQPGTFKALPDNLGS